MKSSGFSFLTNATLVVMNALVGKAAPDDGRLTLLVQILLVITALDVEVDNGFGGKGDLRTSSSCNLGLDLPRPVPLGLPRFWLLDIG